MKNFLRKNWLGLLAIVISVGTWLSFWLRFSPFTWDSFGAMAATMGIIVTFLVGFQIWTVIDNKEFKKEVKAEQKEVKDTLQSVVYQELINQFVINFEFSMVYNEMGRNLFSYLKFALQTIQLGIMSKQIDKCNSVINAMIEVIDKNTLEFRDKQHSILLDIFYNIKEPELIEGLKNKELQYIGDRIRKATII
nr:MAG TPA: hypothetical protein [Caudoviricetes sp.]